MRKKKKQALRDREKEKSLIGHAISRERREKSETQKYRKKDRNRENERQKKGEQ